MQHDLRGKHADTASTTFLAGGGEMGERIRTSDWARTPLGPVEAWPQSLRSPLSMMLPSKAQIILFWGPEYVVFYNDAYRPVFGAKHPHMLGKPGRVAWSEVWETGVNLRGLLDGVVRTGEAFTAKDLLFVVERHGYVEETYFDVSYDPVRIESGAVGGVYCIVTETTGRVVGERRLALLKDLAARNATARSVREACMLAMETLTSRPHDIPFAAAYLDGELLASTPGAQPQLVRELQIGTVGKLVVGLNPQRPFDEQYQSFLDLVADQLATAIANAGAYEEERKRAEALAQIDRAKTLFFSNVSHELRTPLTLILGPIEDALGDAATLPDNQRQRLDVAHRNAQRLLKLVNTLLDFTRIEAGRADANYEPVDLVAFTHDLASSFRSAIERAGLRFRVHGSPLPEPVYVDREMWEKIVLNLLSNAFKFTFDGEIEVSIKPAADRSAAALMVRDTGVGVPQYELPRLFERFHRVENQKSRSFEGSGIGLALVQELVKLHGGDIKVASEVDQGTTFVVTLPLGTDHLPAEKIGGPRKSSATSLRSETFVGEALRWLPQNDKDPPFLRHELAETTDGLLDQRLARASVLVADDNADMREYIGRLLGQTWDLELVPNGEAALQAIRRRRPDLVLTDIMMPRLDGFGLIRVIRSDEALRDLPVIMLSARAGEEARLEGLEAGADDYLTKPFSARELVARITSNLKLAHVRQEATDTLRAESRKLEVLNRTGAVVAAELDVDKIVQLVTDACTELVGAQFGAFFYNIIDNKGESYMLYALSGVPREHFSKFPMPRNTAVFEPTFKGVGVVRSDNIREDPRYGKNDPHYGMPKGHLPVCSYLAVPVVSRSSEVLGGLFFGHGQPSKFSKDHEDLLIGIAGQAATAIDNARLYQAAEREIAERRKAEAALQTLNTTLEKRVEDALAERAESEAQLHQAQKMEAVGRLTGGVAHDFNNLLQVISGSLQLLTKDVAGNARAEQRVRNALAGVSRGSQLASQLLSFGRRQPLAPKVINLGRLIRNWDDMLRRTLGEAIEIETIVAGGLWNTIVDPVQVETAILNLALNARDAMDGRGKLTIEAGNASLDDEYAARHQDVKPGQYVMLAITDTGSGIAPNILERVFEPFFSTKPEGQGTGLGLSMVFGFVKQSDGHIKIYSEPGQGTTVRLYLPRTKAMEDLATDTEAGPITGGSETVLVVEDDEDVRQTAVDMLTDLGYRVLKAKDADSALAIVESGVPIDVLFTDVVMPGNLRSPELARKAKERIPEVVVLFTSGYTDNAIVHGGKLDAGVQLLSKPYSREALARKLRHLINSQQQRPPADQAAGAKRATLASKTSKLRVLLVEDDALIRMSTAEMLQALGHVVREAGNAADALSILKSGTFDVLVTDVSLPGTSGKELATSALAASPSLKVIFATGYDLHEPFAGAVLLRKPYSEQDLRKALQGANRDG